MTMNQQSSMMITSNTTIVSSLPPPPLYGTKLWLIAIPYSTLFFVGLLGNTSVLTYVFFVARSLRSSMLTALGNTFVYIVVLSIVDSFVITSIPFHMTGMIMQDWIFGQTMCKVYWILEMSNKVCSIFILTAMAFDRYMGIVFPNISHIHRSKQTFTIIAILILIAICLLMPIVYSAKVATFKYNAQYYRPIDKTYINIESHVCTDGMKQSTRLFVSTCIFMLGFVLPGFLLAFFYTNMLLRLRKQTRSIVNSRIPMRRVTIYTLSITIFYFLCQLPFWLSQIYGTLIWFYESGNSNQRPNQHNRLMVQIQYICHFFPFVNSAFNWIVYAQLNTQFRKGLHLVTEKMRNKQYRQTSTAGLTTNNNWTINNTDISQYIPHNPYNNYSNNIIPTNNLDDNNICRSCGHDTTIVDNIHSLTLLSEEDEILL